MSGGMARCSVRGVQFVEAPCEDVAEPCVGCAAEGRDLLCSNLALCVDLPTGESFIWKVEK